MWYCQRYTHWNCTVVHRKFRRESPWQGMPAFKNEIHQRGITLLNPLSDDLNLQPRRIEAVPRPGERDMEGALEQVREMLELSRTTLVRAQRRMERSEKLAESLSHQVMALWILVILLIAGGGLLAWFTVLQQRPH